MPSFSANPPPEPLRCPRCGYDQRGVVETWTESCPLSGRCTECGLEFDWWEVMRPQLRLPRWCIEYAERERDLPWAAVKTFLASFWPWYFWSRLRMSHPLRWGRIRLLLALFLLAVLIGYAIEQAAVGTRGWILDERVFTVAITGGWIVLYLLLPLSFVLLPVSRRRAKVRWRHVMRVGAYSFMLPLFLLLLSLMFAIGNVMPAWPLRNWLEAGYSLMLVVIPLVPPLFLPLWWWAAIRQHMRMPHALAVSILLTIMCFFLSWIVTGTIVALIIWLFE